MALREEAISNQCQVREQRQVPVCATASPRKTLVRPEIHSSNAISHVGIHENVIVGHISFTLCHVEEGKDKVALLALLSVTPTQH